MPSSSQFESSDEDSRDVDKGDDSENGSTTTSDNEESSDFDSVSQRDRDNDDEEEGLSPPFDGSEDGNSTGSNYTSEIERAESLLRSSSSKELPKHNDRDLSASSSSGTPEHTLPPGHALKVKLTRRTLEQYIQLFKDLQTSSSAIHDPLEGSLIGSSLWTAAEKHAFFASLSRHGRHARDRISGDVESKSALEIRQYMLLLEGTPSETAHGQSEPAHEISQVLEELLDKFSDHIEANQLDQACAADKQRFGDLWILDASTIEETGEASQVAEGTSDDRSDDLEGPQQHEETQEPENRAPLTSLEVLRPSKLIELMQNVFMNAKYPLEDNWQHLAISAIGSEGPSILRSAFEELHLIIVNLVRRLVPAIIMQALSRLRSIKDPNVAHKVRAGDVTAALQVLGLPRHLPGSYWLNAVSQRSISVFSRSEQFKQDRISSTRLGYRLTKQQLEKCLLETNDPLDVPMKQEPSPSGQHTSALSVMTTSSGSERDMSQDDFSDDSDVQDLAQDPEDAELDRIEEMAEQIDTHDAILAAKDENYLRDRLDLPQSEADILIKHEKRTKHYVFTSNEQWPPLDDGYVAEWELSRRKKRRLTIGGSRHPKQSLIRFASADSDVDMDESEGESAGHDTAEESP